MNKVDSICQSVKHRYLNPSHLLMLVILFISFALIGNVNSQDKILPNDEYISRQLSFHNNGGRVELKKYSISRKTTVINTHRDIHLNIAGAWAISTGSRDVIVAILDDGFFYNHEDLAGNIWINPGESGIDENGVVKRANGIDDDNNGYIDDVFGWDFIFDDPDPDCYIFDGRDMGKIAMYGHATSAMGIIGARGNNEIGVAGINWDISMMLLKTCAQGTTVAKRAENTAEAIRYAVDNGARIINWSGGVGIYDSTTLRILHDAIDYAERYDVLIVAAAGNSLKNIDLDENTFYPACFHNDNIITVGEVDFDGTLYVEPEGTKFIGGSNFGVKNVDITAIAQNYTAQLFNTVGIYGIGAGTSDAAPVISGVAALIYSIRPDLNGPEVKRILIQSCRKLPDLVGKVGSGGMVDACEALKLAQKWKK